MLVFTIIALALALVCCILATAINHVRAPDTSPVAKTNWLALGLAVWMLLQLIDALVAGRA